MTVTLNGSAVKYKPGVYIKEKLTEDLDVGMVIVYSNTELTVEPMDEVVISESGVFTKKMLESDIKRTTSKLKGTKRYTYKLGLVSPTIQLQRIVLPNRSITQPLTGTKTSIYTVLNQYVSMYSSFTISSALETLTTSVDCPEFQWNRPTLFEVINDLLSEVDACVTFTAGSSTELNYLDLNQTGSAIAGNFNEIELTQNITDYANKVEAEVENAVVNKANTRVVEWVALKTKDDVLVTTDNAKFYLEKPIDKINSISARFVTDASVFTGPTADITSRVVEKTQYDLAYTSSTAGTVSGNYKRDRLYFERGSNVIDGVCYNEDTWFGTPTLKALINVLINAYYEETSVTATIVNTDLLDIVIKVDYQALETVKLISNKSTAYTTLTTEDSIKLINNQDTSYVDFGAFARKQQQTMNRLGNAVLTYTGRCDSYADIPDLGDYEDSYKVAEREFSLYKDYCTFKLTCAENYVLKDIFTGMKQQRRYTKIATNSDALECNHIKEYYFNLSKSADNQVSINSNTLDTTLENYIFKFAEADEQIKLIHFKSDSNTDIGVTPSAYYTNRSIILTYKMQDNFSAGLQIDDSTSSYLQNYVPYVDSNGKFTSFVFKMYKGYDFTSEDPQVTYPIHKIRQLPELDTSLLNASDLVYTSGTLTRYKDNREITVETIQFNFSHGTGVFYGNKFFADSPMTYTETTDTTLYVAYSTTLTYSEGDQTYKGTIADAANLTYTKSSNDITISSPDSSITISELASWAIVDSTGNIYLAVNV